jgi:hypothetical protein
MNPMFFKLVKEIPQMFAIAAIIWFFVLIVFNKNSKKKNASFFTKHQSTIIVIVLALILTIADIWVFISYIPTHYKKAPVEVPAISTNELLNDSAVVDTTYHTVLDNNKKDTGKQVKNAITLIAEKVLITNKASIRFYSHGLAEDIEATNSSVACSFNETTGQLKFTGLIRGFVFENEMMQEHFNDKDYMNSAVFPKTSFKGIVQNIKSIDFSKDGNTKVTAEGTISIHGVSKSITAQGSVVIAGGKPTLKSVFKIKRADFGINTDEIAEELEITVISEFK